MALQFKDGPFKGSYTTNDFSRGPQRDIASAFEPSFGPRNPSTPQPTSTPKTQSAPYQAYAQQGQAQSIPTQSQGTPYQAYAQPSKPTLRPASQTVTGDWQGSYAAAPASQRPPPFQMGAAQTPWGQSMDPFAERDAFINQLNQQRIQNQVAFNSGGMTDPTAGMTPGLNYQQAMQQAGLGGGAPSMSADYGDSLISRLNQAFGGQGDPFAFAQPQVTPYQPYVNQQGQQFRGTMSFEPGTSQAYQNQAYGNYANQQGYYQPQGAPAMTQQAQASLPSQGTLPSWAVGSPLDQPPGAMNWSDWARIQQQQASPPQRSPGVYDGRPTPEGEWQKSARNENAPILFYPKGARDADMSYGEWPRGVPLPSQKAYSPVSTVGQPPQPPTGPANPYGPPVIDRPAPPQVPQAKDQNRAQFLQDKAYGRIDSPTATYDSHVKTTLENVTGQVVNSPGGVELYNQYQSSDPAKRLAAAERLKSLIYDRALQQGVAPGDEWFSKKTGKSAAGGRDQYFNEAMAKHSAKQSPAGKAQSIQPPSQGTPYQSGQQSGFKYDKDPTLGNAEFQKWLDVKAPARFMLYDRAANERMYDQFLAEKGQTPSQITQQGQQIPRPSREIMSSPAAEAEYYKKQKAALPKQGQPQQELDDDRYVPYMNRPWQVRA